jgi:hypothetical protein
MLHHLKEKNGNIHLFDINSHAFRPYGRLISGYDFSSLINYMVSTGIPEEGNVYVASDPEMEQYEIKSLLESHFYGGMEIEIGYCNGRNSSLNGLEYHKGSEINVAVTDFVLLLGKVQDIEEQQYSVDHLEAFYVPKGTVLEMYGTTLHFSPCKVTDNGFKCIVILPKGTNTPIEKRDPVSAEDEFLFMKNKWLLAHPERTVLIERGAFPGITGPNIEVKY